MFIGERERGGMPPFSPPERSISRFPIWSSVGLSSFVITPSVIPHTSINYADLPLDYIYSLIIPVLLSIAARLEYWFVSPKIYLCPVPHAPSLVLWRMLYYALAIVCSTCFLPRSSSSFSFSSRLHDVYLIEQVIQYIDLVDHNTEGSSNSPSGYYSENGMIFPFIPTKDFAFDGHGHGMHVAGTAAGSTIDSPATLVECDDGEVMGCAGTCLDPDSSKSTDEHDYGSPAIDRLCPMFDCEGAVEDSQCLSDDVAETVAEHGGMAQGAKLAVFDAFSGDTGYGDLAGVGLFEASLNTGAKIHSNSWGFDNRCQLAALDLVYDDFMFQVGGRSKFDAFERRSLMLEYRVLP